VQLAGPAKRRLGGFTSTSVADKDLLSNSEKDLSEGELLSDGETQVEAMNYSYIQRLMLVHNIMGLEIEQEQELVSTDFGSRKKRPKVKLPPALGFPEMFEAYMGEIKAIEGSKRGGKDPKLPLDVLKVPIRTRPNLRAYDIKGGWRKQASIMNSSLTSATAFEFSSVPKNTAVPSARLSDWESSAREELSVASYNTWFLVAARNALKTLQQKFLDNKNRQSSESTTAAEWDSLWNDTEDILDLVDSAGRGTKVIAENAVSDIGSLTLTRRDAWLGPLVEKKKITKQDLWDLRNHDLNSTNLFDESTLERIHVKTEKSLADKLQRRLVYGCIEKSKQPFKENKQQPQRRPPPEPQRSSFRGSAQNNSAPAYGSGRGSFRGGNRGGGFRGRGFNKKPHVPQPSGKKD